MKKYIALLLIIILFGCSSNKINIEGTNKILFSFNDIELNVKQEKYKEIIQCVEALDTQKIGNYQVNDEFTISIYSNDTYHLYLNDSQNVILNKNNKYYICDNSDEIIDLYQKIMGKNIFFGQLVYNSNYIEEPIKDKVLFNVDSTQINDIVINKGGNHFLKENKIDDFIHELNKITYQNVVDVNDRYGTVGSITLHYDNYCYSFDFFKSSDNKNVITITLDFVTGNQKDYILSDNAFLKMYQEIMGENIFDNPTVQNISNEWIEKTLTEEEYYGKIFGSPKFSP